MQMLGLPIDYIATRNEKVEAVTLGRRAPCGRQSCWTPNNSTLSWSLANLSVFES